MSSRSNRSSMSPFRSRKSPVPSPSTKTTGRPATPSSTTSSRPPSRLSSSPATSSSPNPGPSPSTVVVERLESSKSKENVTVTVRFRPLSPREINKGDEIAWYADGDFTVRNEFNPSIAYGFDRVFGPATTTRHVYDAAAQHVISGAMQGINGTVFAYGVTSSGKTHTMHGEQKSPGIIPLAVKDVFATIQETPEREFLLRVSYLEIYNEVLLIKLDVATPRVINDLLDPIGQNLRIREDAQGTYVEGIKEEVVLSPAHALSLIATGEEHRHVGSNNFNLLSSRSHTIFTLTIESSPRGEKNGDEDVTLSQLNLIDLAGSESSKAETTGLRRKEGSYINKSLLTLGTVISKLTDGKATHIPYRDSKLTRLLQSSLSGRGRISLICTVTPASSNSEETHNTLKFAHRSKHVEIKASQNKIMDEKSLIKKYQKEISSLKHELEQLRQGMMERPYTAVTTQDDLVNLKLQLEAGQVKLQSRLEEEEQAKAALMGRIQRLTKLILVSTKNSMSSSIPERSRHRRRHSFGEDELAYLPDRKREYMIDDDAGSCASELSVEGRDDVANLDELVKDYKGNRRRGMLGWFKLRVESSERRLIRQLLIHLPERTQAVDLVLVPLWRVGLAIIRIKILQMLQSYQLNYSNFPTFIDFILIQQTKLDQTMFEKFHLQKPENQAGMSPSADNGSSASGSPASCSKSLQDKGTLNDMKDGRRKSVSRRGDDPAIVDSFPERTQAGDLFSATVGGRLPPDIRATQIYQKRVLRGCVRFRMIIEVTLFCLPALLKLATNLNEKTFELEIKSADNRVLQEQLQVKIAENSEMQETILLLRQQLKNKSSRNPQESADNVAKETCSKEFFEKMKNGIVSCEETYGDDNTPTSVMSLNRVFSQDDSKECDKCTSLNSQVLIQAAEIESLKQEKVKLAEEKDGLEVHSNKLAEEASYAKELAAAAAVELRNLAEEVTRLSYENAKLTGELAAAKEARCRSNCCQRTMHNFRRNNMSGAWPEAHHRKQEDELLIEELQKELSMRNQREAALEAALSERELMEGDLRRRINEAKRHEEHLENELANMWMLVAKMRKLGVNVEDISSSIAQTGERNGPLPSNGHSFKLLKPEEACENLHGMKTYEELRACYQEERRRCEELERLVSRMKGEDISGLDVTSLEELKNFHVEAITKICHAKCANFML
ncbi:hypothetical protein GOBAR_AA29777 [Gossypium barbadense]|uniref:Kinesin motor domain-containing protein n=1 Tax=Gossypium barbadense TaxID=3634 RepID=A0A2P5WIK2_GOSBA|nr:hypothetical protein GOBAR_AA29777 [Gossypium barbadense]